MFISKQQHTFLYKTLCLSVRTEHFALFMDTGQFAFFLQGSGPGLKLHQLCCLDPDFNTDPLIYISQESLYVLYRLRQMASNGNKKPTRGKTTIILGRNIDRKTKLYLFWVKGSGRKFWSLLNYSSNLSSINIRSTYVNFQSGPPCPTP